MADWSSELENEKFAWRSTKSSFMSSITFVHITNTHYSMAWSIFNPKWSVLYIPIDLVLKMVWNVNSVRQPWKFMNCVLKTLKCICILKINIFFKFNSLFFHDFGRLILHFSTHWPEKQGYIARYFTRSGSAWYSCDDHSKLFNAMGGLQQSNGIRRPGRHQFLCLAAQSCFCQRKVHGNFFDAFWRHHYFNFPEGQKRAFKIGRPSIQKVFLVVQQREVTVGLSVGRRNNGGKVCWGETRKILRRV